MVKVLLIVLGIFIYCVVGAFIDGWLADSEYESSSIILILFWPIVIVAIPILGFWGLIYDLGYTLKSLGRKRNLKSAIPRKRRYK